MKFLRLLILLCFCISCSCSKTVDPVTEPDPIVIVPDIPENELLDQVEKDALKYFWDFAQTNSKLARERYHVEDTGNDANIVATGGSGFGIMTILVGIQRGFINRQEAVNRLETSLTFLENADRFHGAWSHWINGTNGDVIPFGTFDNGGDLVETSFLCQGLICLREYFKNGTVQERALAAKADTLWKGVEWNWYTKGGENVLYWHWSPNYNWQMNFKLQGYNECLITYVMAKCSPTFPVSNAVYTNGWARNGQIKSTTLHFGLPRIFSHNGTSIVGPMFWAHYSHLGLDPRGLSDQYANYWTLNQNHAKIMLNFCVANPNGYKEYSDKVWGLTASYSRNPDGSVGYDAHQPTNDKGIISPTAALSNFPYTPVESLKFLRYLYQEKKATLVGVAGPYDAFSPHFNWVTKRYLAIDQGTIAPMIENHRTGMLWNLFMNAPEIKAGLQSLGFSSTQHSF